MSILASLHHVALILSVVKLMSNRFALACQNIAAVHHCVDLNVPSHRSVHSTRLVSIKNVLIPVREPVAQMPFVRSVITVHCVRVELVSPEIHSLCVDQYLVSFYRPFCAMFGFIKPMIFFVKLNLRSKRYKKHPSILASHRHVAPIQCVEMWEIHQHVLVYQITLERHLNADLSVWSTQIVPAVRLALMRNVAILVWVPVVLELCVRLIITLQTVDVLQVIPVIHLPRVAQHHHLHQHVSLVGT